MSNQNNVTSVTSFPIANIPNIQNGISNIQYSRFSDWVLVVEGSTDRDFYAAYTKLREIYNEETIYKLEKTKAIKNRLNYLNIKKVAQKENIICIINEKRKEGKHFYGIVDNDYQFSDFKDSVKYIHADKENYNNIFENYVKATDANSLETMMIKYAGTSEFTNILKQVRAQQTLQHPDFSLITEQDVCDALEFAFYIGLLRQYNEDYDGKNGRLRFKTTVKETNFYYSFVKQALSINAFKSKYLYELLKNSPNSFLSVSNLQNVLNVPYSQNQAWDICQGHDVIDFIEAILLNREFIQQPNVRKSIIKYLKKRYKANKTRYKPTKNESVIIDVYNNYSLKFFYSSSIYSWLQKIDYEKERFQSDFQKRISIFLNRPLKNFYPIIYITSLNYYIQSKPFCAYIFFGITTDGFNDILDIKTIEKKKMKNKNILLWGAEIKERGLLSIKDVYLEKFISDKNALEKNFSVIYPKTIFHMEDFPINIQNPKTIFKRIYKQYKNISFNTEIDFWESINLTISALENDKSWKTIVKF